MNLSKPQLTRLFEGMDQVNNLSNKTDMKKYSRNSNVVGDSSNMIDSLMSLPGGSITPSAIEKLTKRKIK